jgi:dolichol-phosphate mannosyltransferase
MSRPDPATLAIIVPCFNEEAVIEATHARLSRALDELDCDCQIIYVNDGSHDRTAQLLAAIQQGDSRVRVLEFSRNFGHQTAVTAGIDHAEADAVVLIDADLQDPPEIIPQMVELWRQGFDVVYAQRTRRRGETKFKLLTAAAYYRLLDWLSDTEIPHDTGDFRLMNRCVVEALRQMPERDRFLRGMISWVGFRQVALPYERAERFAGQSKYPLWKMLRFAADGILSFSLKPLRLATGMGLAATALALMGIVYGLTARLFTSNWEPGWTTLFCAITFLGGVQLICTGIIGEYVGRIYRENKQRPLYLVQERRGFGESVPTARIASPADSLAQDAA